jgi:AraC-like DNA-binding protein
MVKKLIVEFALDPASLQNHDGFIHEIQNLLTGIARSYQGGAVAVRTSMAEDFPEDPFQPYSGVRYEVDGLTFDVHSTMQTPNDFLNKCVTCIVTHADDCTFTQCQMASMLNLSKPTFYRKIKYLTGQSVKEFILTIKMQLAVQLLQTRKYTVSEVAWKCGYNSTRHFSKRFFRTFKQYPSKINVQPTL